MLARTLFIEVFGWLAPADRFLAIGLPGHAVLLVRISEFLLTAFKINNKRKPECSQVRGVALLILTACVPTSVLCTISPLLKAVQKANVQSGPLQFCVAFILASCFASAWFCPTSHSGIPPQTLWKQTTRIMFARVKRKTCKWVVESQAYITATRSCSHCIFSTRLLDPYFQQQPNTVCPSKVMPTTNIYNLLGWQDSSLVGFRLYIRWPPTISYVFISGCLQDLQIALVLSRYLRLSVTHGWFIPYGCCRFPVFSARNAGIFAAHSSWRIHPPSRRRTALANLEAQGRYQQGLDGANREPPHISPIRRTVLTQIETWYIISPHVMNDSSHSAVRVSAPACAFAKCFERMIPAVHMCGVTCVGVVCRQFEVHSESDSLFWKCNRMDKRN